ncbi:MAG: hypothetical protein WCY01_01575 [Alkalispirochaeta sp.]
MGSCATISALLVLLVLLTGCGPEMELRVPEVFGRPPFLADLERALAGEDKRQPAVRVTATDDQSEDGALGFVICAGSGDECRSLEFGDDGLIEATGTALAMSNNQAASDVPDRTGSLLLVLDRRREYLQKPIEEHIAELAAEHNLPVDIVIQESSESVDEFADRIFGLLSPVQALQALPVRGAVVAAGRAGTAVLRRIGPGASSAGGIPPLVVELFLSPSGNDLVEAGYPLAGSISYDFSGVADQFRAGRQSFETIRVPLRFFRY